MIRRLAFGVAVLLVAPQLQADEGSLPKPGVGGAPIEVEVIGERRGALQAVPGSGTVIGAREIDRAEPLVAASLLRRVPGVQVRQEVTSGLRFDVGIRGLDASRSRRVLLLEDGVPLASNPYAQPDLPFAPSIERMRAIEVVKGSGSILFGPQTIGGVVNFLTLAPPSSRRVRLSLDGGVPGYVRALGSYGDSFRDVRYLVQTLHKQGSGVRGEGFRADDVLAKVAFETSARGEAMVKLGVHDESAGSAEVGLTRAMFERDPRRPTLTPHNLLHARKIEASVIHEQQLTPETRLRTLLYAHTLGFSFRRQDYDRAPVPGVSYERIVGDTAAAGGALFFKHTNRILEGRYEVLGIEPRIEHRLTTLGVRHTLDAGARFLVESGHRAQRLGQSPTSDAGDLALDEGHRSYAVAIYAQDRITFRDDLVVTPGVRVEHADYFRHVGRKIVGTAPVDVSIEGDSHVNGVIPGIGMTYGTAERHVFGGLHLGFAPPRVETAIADTGQDQALLPERSLNYELGARVALASWLKLEATGFLENFENQILPQGLGAGGPILVNTGRTRHLGVESAALVGLGAALDLGLTIDLGARYTFSRATYVGGPNADHLLPYAPLHTASVTLDVEHRIGVGAQIDWLFVGPRFTDSQNLGPVDVTGRAGQIDAYNVLDLGLRYREKRTGLSASLRVTNLFDTVYESGRAPDGIFTGSFRQVIGGLGWNAR